MTRLTAEELEKVKKKYNVSRLWSWSRVNCFMTSPYEYFLKYVLNKKEDRTDCAYAPVGSIAHSALEQYYSDEIQYDDMIKYFEDEWDVHVEIADLKFDRNDEEKNSSIKTKYKKDIEHFFKNHVPIKHKVAVEKFITTKIEGQVFQGYIDAIYKDDDGCYNIIDFKTSSKFSSKALEEKSGQLTVYAIGLMQMGVPLEKIRIGFNMLKYCTVQYHQKNGAVKTRDIERYKIGDSLQTNVCMWLKDAGYSEDDIEYYSETIAETNNIDILPEEVRKKYEVSDCYVWVPLTQKLVDTWTKTITATIKDICAREKDYEEDKNDKVFWDDDESVRAESYYFATLMGYSANLHLPYKKYLEELEEKKSGIDMFSGVGSETDDNQTKTIESNNESNDLDLSWLDEL